MNIVGIAFGFLAWLGSMALTLLAATACFAFVYLLGGSDLFAPAGKVLAVGIACQIGVACYAIYRSVKNQ